MAVVPPPAGGRGMSWNGRKPLQLALRRLLPPAKAADWRSRDRVGRVLYDPETVALIEAVSRNIGNRSPKRESCRKLLLCFIKQRCANALALSFWRDEKLVKNAILGDGRK